MHIDHHFLKLSAQEKQCAMLEEADRYRLSKRAQEYRQGIGSRLGIYLGNGLIEIGNFLIRISLRDSV